MTTKKTATKKRTSARRATKKSAPKKKWSRVVTEHNNALDLEEGVFKNKNSKKLLNH